MGPSALRIEDLPHYTYDDYVHWEGNWELIRGIPYAMTPAPTIRHQELSFKIGMQLYQSLKNSKRCRSLLGVDWQIAEDTVVRPDNLVVCGKILGRKRLTTPPTIVFEILSPSTTRHDKIMKYQLYEDAGVKYYCIADPDTNSAVVFQLQRSKYGEIEDFRDGKVTFDLGPGIIDFDFNELFKE